MGSEMCIRDRSYSGNQSSLEIFMKIEVKDNNIEQALRVLKRKLQRDGFFKVIKLKNTYEKPSEKKKRILQENIKRVKKLNKLKNRI